MSMYVCVWTYECTCLRTCMHMQRGQRSVLGVSFLLLSTFLVSFLFCLRKFLKKYFLHFFWRVSFQVYHCSFEDTEVFSSFSLFSLNICFFISAIWLYVARQNLQSLIYFLNSVGYVSFQTFGATSGSFIAPLLCSILLRLQWCHGYVNFPLVYL